MAQFYAEHGFWLWAAVGAGLLALEVVFGSGYLLWPAASAGLVSLFVLARLSPGLPVELGLFAVVTIVTSLIARRIFPPSPADGPNINDARHRLAGRQGYAVGAFRGVEGRVFVDGKEWAAEAEADAKLADGDRIEVVSVTGGAALKVKRAGL